MFIVGGGWLNTAELGLNVGIWSFYVNRGEPSLGGGGVRFHSILNAEQRSRL